MKKIYLLFIVVSLAFISCTKTEEVIDDQKEETLTNEQIVEGLKEALKVGTDTAVSIVSKVDGYFADSLIKISVPASSKELIDSADVLGNQSEIDDLILKINRSAEDAANEATDIFVAIITNMTFVDAVNILHGSDSAATHFLRENAYYDLYQGYKPKIEESLAKELNSGTSANSVWASVTTTYNDAYPSDPVGADLSTHVTEKAIDGLLEKIKAEEKQIREDPLARVNDILKRVFSELD